MSAELHDVGYLSGREGGNSLCVRVTGLVNLVLVQCGISDHLAGVFASEPLPALRAELGMLLPIKRMARTAPHLPAHIALVAARSVTCSAGRHVVVQSGR